MYHYICRPCSSQATPDVRPALAQVAFMGLDSRVLLPLWVLSHTARDSLVLNVL